jgi:hypothetical protein
MRHYVMTPDRMGIVSVVRCYPSSKIPQTACPADMYLPGITLAGFEINPSELRLKGGGAFDATTMCL